MGPVSKFSLFHLPRPESAHQGPKRVRQTHPNPQHSTRLQNRPELTLHNTLGPKRQVSPGPKHQTFENIENKFELAGNQDHGTDAKTTVQYEDDTEFGQGDDNHDEPDSGKKI